MLETSLLATVAAVVREGSFERAARVLHITPSAVSQRIRLIEERVGTVLVVRGQPCTPTEAGARLCRHAQTVTMLEDGLRRDMPELLPEQSAGEHATIRIAINADSLGTWFMAALHDFCRVDGPLIDLSVDDQDKTGDWLKRGHVLAAVTSLARPVQGCRSRKLGALRYCATASPAFVARRFASGVTAETLARAPSLVFDRNDRLQEQWVRRLFRKDVPLPAHRLPSPQAFVEAALAGIGWGMNPLHLVKEHLRTGRLVELVAARPLDVPLYWQAAKLPLPELERLSQSVHKVAGTLLVP
ncbi:MAG: LysR family transcriptional regulator ArgP [Betaproteobacteria bacterium]|nr:LysR family transcriptional regulator ArgP [Betaproteobacteria bacterium]